MPQDSGASTGSSFPWSADVHLRTGEQEVGERMLSSGCCPWKRRWASKQLRPVPKSLDRENDRQRPSWGLPPCGGGFFFFFFLFFLR